MIELPPPPLAALPGPETDALTSALIALRPELHRYCARLTGSLFDGEDIVQAALLRAWEKRAQAVALRALRPWVFRIAHHLAIDHLRRQSHREAAPLEDAFDLADVAEPDPAEALAQQELTALALQRFLTLPIGPRSTVILKDVLGHSLEEIGQLLELSLPAVKAGLHRGRRRLQALAASERAGTVGTGRPELPPSPGESPELARYIALFNARAWPQLRELLAEDVRLEQVGRSRCTGRADVGQFFTFYAAYDDARLRPATVEGREVAAVHPRTPGAAALAPAYFMELAWHPDGRIGSIRDFRYVRYIAESLGWA